MKHVFVVNSHTTFMTAIGTVEYLKHMQDDVIILYVRNYKNSVVNLPYKIYDMSLLSTETEQMHKKHYRIQRCIKKTDSFVDEYVCSEYSLYAPHLAHPFWQMLYTNEKCADFSYIQEGAIPFQKAYHEVLTFREKVKAFIHNKILYRTKRIWYPHYWYVRGTLYKQDRINSYSTNNIFFKYLHSDNHIIKWPLFEIKKELDYGAKVFIFDGFITNSLIEPYFYLESCKKLIEEYAAEKNYIKFHPAQSEKEKEMICSYFNVKKVEYIILDDSIPFELYISTMKSLTLVGFGSSLLYFGKDKGHTVICKDYWLERSTIYMANRTAFGYENFKTFYGIK